MLCSKTRDWRQRRRRVRDENDEIELADLNIADVVSAVEGKDSDELTLSSEIFKRRDESGL